jgi:L-alanine-DL-glutamate epimerase-like enolase superfamily enzyme
MPFPTPIGVFGGSAGVLNGGSSVVTLPDPGPICRCGMGQAGQAAASAAIPAFSALRRVSLKFAHPSAFIIRTCQSSYDPVHASVQQCASMKMALQARSTSRTCAAVGSGFDLMQEANMRLSLEQCLELAPVLEDLKFHWFEEPIGTGRPNSLEGYLKVRAACPHVMVSGGESRTNRFEFKEWIDRDAYDIVQPDCNVTGLTEAWHIARLANLRQKYCCPHNWHGGLTTMANAALVAAIPNRHMLELNQTYNPFKEEIFKDPLVVRKGYMDLHNKPGFGMELKPGIADKFPYIPGRYDRPNPDLPPLP